MSLFDGHLQPWQRLHGSGGMQGVCTASAEELSGVTFWVSLTVTVGFSGAVSRRLVMVAFEDAKEGGFEDMKDGGDEQVYEGRLEEESKGDSKGEECSGGIL